MKLNVLIYIIISFLIFLVRLADLFDMIFLKKVIIVQEIN